ncbi:hypothetical protein MKW92_027630 [Papaver armeniacum]|nr:hypothetical protein MKW92_027630 [Papaver armeniacum]
MPSLTLLHMGRRCIALHSTWIHRSNVFVATSILHMYGELGSIECAAKQFKRVEEKNVAVWICRHSLCQTWPCHSNPLTFMGVLIACTHAGLVEEALDCFKCMTQDYGITPDMHHYAAMVDVLGRAGKLKEALEFIVAMPVTPTAPVWGSLMAASALHHDIKLGHEAAKIVMRMEPENPGNFVFLCNMMAQDGRWDDVNVVRETMKLRGLEKIPGHSSIS